MIAGVDEVGRGPLAGPVVACAVVMPPDVRAIAGVDDSDFGIFQVRGEPFGGNDWLNCRGRGGKYKGVQHGRTPGSF